MCSTAVLRFSGGLDIFLALDTNCWNLATLALSHTRDDNAMKKMNSGNNGVFLATTCMYLGLYFSLNWALPTREDTRVQFFCLVGQKESSNLFLETHYKCIYSYTYE
jgi:hypothetical protein